MEQVVTRLIQREGYCLVANGNKIDCAYVSVPVPDEPYQVIYVLSETGELRVAADTGSLHPWIHGRNTKAMAVCFIPHSWKGKRVNRYVVPLSAAKGTA